MITDCPKCKREIEAEDSWAGATVECPHCRKQITLPMTHEQQQSASRASFGSLLVFCGLICAAYFFLFYDTSVPTESHYVPGYGSIGGERVHNQGLMQNRLLGCIAGISATVIGTVIVISASKKS